MAGALSHPTGCHRQQEVCSRPPLSAGNWDTLRLLEGRTAVTEKDVSETH